MNNISYLLLYCCCFTYYQSIYAQCPAVGDLVITELLIDPQGSDSNKEYVELYNSSSSSIDLDGFRLHDDGGDSHIINTSVIVAPGTYIILGGRDVSVNNGGLSVDYVYTYAEFRLVNDSATDDPVDEVIISCNGVEIDRLNYNRDFPILTGVSLNLNPNNLDAISNDDPSNWCESTTEITSGGNLGTPGMANNNCPLPTQCAAVGDLVITEFLADPAGGDANKEYIELYNNSSSSIDLSGFELHDDDGESADGIKNSHIISTSVIVAPGAYIILGERDVPINNGGLSIDYDYTDPNFGLRNDSATDDPVDEIIISCDGVEIDRVNYNRDFQITEGVSNSLRPNSLNATANDDASNWCHSTTEITSGGNLGTPGMTNNSCGGLPVELLAFAGNQVKETVVLKWQTISEINHSRYLIEHSTDGSTFVKIGELKKQNFNNRTTDYKFSHLTPVKGNNFYRLRSMDWSDQFSLSAIIQIHFNEENKIIIFPNPATNRLMLTGIDDSFINYQIINQLGQVVEMKQDNNNEIIRIDHLSSGVYFLNIQMKNTTQTQRFIKK